MNELPMNTKVVFVTSSQAPVGEREIWDGEELRRIRQHSYTMSSPELPSGGAQLKRDALAGGNECTYGSAAETNVCALARLVPFRSPVRPVNVCSVPQYFGVWSRKKRYERIAASQCVFCAARALLWRRPNMAT